MPRGSVSGSNFLGHHTTFCGWAVLVGAARDWKCGARKASSNRIWIWRSCPWFIVVG